MQTRNTAGSRASQGKSQELSLSHKWSKDSEMGREFQAVGGQEGWDMVKEQNSRAKAD